MTKELEAAVRDARLGFGGCGEGHDPWERSCDWCWDTLQRNSEALLDFVVATEHTLTQPATEQPSGFRVTINGVHSPAHDEFLNDVHKQQEESLSGPTITLEELKASMFPDAAAEPELAAEALGESALCAGCGHMLYYHSHQAAKGFQGCHVGAGGRKVQCICPLFQPAQPTEAVCEHNCDCVWPDDDKSGVCPKCGCFLLVPKEPAPPAASDGDKIEGSTDSAADPNLSGK